MTTKGLGGISYMHFLPCLRCGQDSVGVSLLGGAVRRENVWCLAKKCEAVHYLRIAQDAEGLDVAYDRYTLGGELEAYDDSGALLEAGPAGSRKQPAEDDGFSGPVAVYPPKRHFSAADARAAWSASGGRCHLCGRRWRAHERGPAGWQIDRVIPYAGQVPGGVSGGYRLACAACEPGRGRRFRRAHLLRSIRDLVARLTPSNRGGTAERKPKAGAGRRRPQRRSSSR